jgi:hypothetical protein
MQLVVAALRTFQLLFGIVIIGLTATLIKDQVFNGTLPSSIAYAAFAGAFGIIAGVVTIVALWVDAIQIIFVLGLDALATVFYIAGGVVLAVKLKGVSCSSGSDRNIIDMSDNELLNGGCAQAKNIRICGYAGEESKDKLLSRCKMNQADSVFMFLSIVVIIAAAVISFLRVGRK